MDMRCGKRVGRILLRLPQSLFQQRTANPPRRRELYYNDGGQIRGDRPRAYLRIYCARATAVQAERSSRYQGGWNAFCTLPARDDRAQKESERSAGRTAERAVDSDEDGGEFGDQHAIATFVLRGVERPVGALDPAAEASPGTSAATPMLTVTESEFPRRSIVIERTVFAAARPLSWSRRATNPSVRRRTPHRRSARRSLPCAGMS